MSKVVLVTGGTRGIGFETAKKFLNEGYKVVVASFDRGEATENVMAELKALGDATFVGCNVASRQDCEKAVATAVEVYGQVDILANVAGVVGERQAFLSVDLEDTLNTIQVNLMGTIQMSQFASQDMAKRKSGVIINVGSICGVMANTESVGYHASKGGVKMATDAMARELSPYGIRVVSVAPGWVRTGMIDKPIEEIGSRLHMKGRIIEPIEVANAIYLMSLPEASAINGTTVMADDGYASFKGVDGYQA